LSNVNNVVSLIDTTIMIINSNGNLNSANYNEILNLYNNAEYCHSKLFDLLGQVQALVCDIQTASELPNPNNIDLGEVFYVAEWLSIRVLDQGTHPLENRLEQSGSRLKVLNPDFISFK
jgi:hypothetical protein